MTCDLCGVASWVDGNELLLCDACPKAFHCQCLTPQMHSVPEGDWFCPSCGAAANSPPDDATATATAAFSSTTTSSSAAASIATALWDRLCTAHATPTAASEPQQQPPRRLPRQIKGPVGSHVTASGEIDSIDKVLDGRMVGAHPDVKVQASGDDAALDVATIDATLWAGAAAAGWSLEHNECSGKVEYVSPSGKRFGTLQYIRKKFGGAGGAGGVGGAGGGGGRSGRSARSARGGKAYVENDGDDKEDEEEDRGETCEVCGLESWIEGNELLLCDTCPKAFHTQCLTPPLASVPEGDWICPSCASATNPPAGKSAAARSAKQEIKARPDCGTCINCLDKPKFGRENQRHKTCKLKLDAIKRLAPELGGRPAKEPKEKKLRSQGKASAEAALGLMKTIEPAEDELNSIEKILDGRMVAGGVPGEEEYLCKERGLAHVHALWLSVAEIEKNGRLSKQRLTNFLRKREKDGGLIDPYLSCMEVERVIAVHSESAAPPPPSPKKRKPKGVDEDEVAGAEGVDEDEVAGAEGVDEDEVAGAEGVEADEGDVLLVEESEEEASDSAELAAKIHQEASDSAELAAKIHQDSSDSAKLAAKIHQDSSDSAETAAKAPRAATEAAEGEEEGEEGGKETYYLVKWRGLGYEGCTWEYARVAGADAIAAYEERQKVLANKAASDAEPPTPEVDVPMSFKDGRTLRDYQRAGVQWMRWNYVRGRSVILGDEMGLGKTAQSATLLHCLHTFHKAKGPYLIVVPLSTVPHWQREVRDWTSLHAVLFH